MTENDLIEFRRLRDKRQGTVTNAAPDPASRARVADAVQARLDAGKAKFAAAEATAKAKQAVAALQPAARAVQQPAATMPPGLSASERRAFTKSQCAWTASNARTFDDSYLRQAAVNPLSPPAEAAIAKAELEARGVRFGPGNITSQSPI